MLNTMIVAAVTNFSGTTTPDKNGQNPVMLQCIAGTMPNRNVLAGTVAQRAGFDVGKTYLVNVRETGFDKIFGADFTFIKIMELTSGLDIVRAAKELGEAKILYVERPEGFEQHYQRKGTAVESNRAVRIREGLYEPAVATTIADHRTASQRIIGTSVNSGGRVVGQHDMLEDEEGPLFPEPEDENVHYEDDQDDQNPDNENEQDPDENPEQQEVANDRTGHRTEGSAEQEPDRQDAEQRQRQDNQNRGGRNRGGGNRGR